MKAGNLITINIETIGGAFIECERAELIRVLKGVTENLEAMDRMPTGLRINDSKGLHAGGMTIQPIDCAGAFV